ANGVLDEGIQYWLEIERRAADDLEDLGGGRLLLQRFEHLSVSLSQRRVLLLQLREQPHIRDGNYRLVGKGLEERNLVFGERSRFGTPNGDAADHRTPVQYWYPNGAAAAERDP